MYTATTTNQPAKTIRFYAGLTLAGTASAVLTCLFSLLHLQVFFKAYHLPLEVYSVGSSIFAVVNTANDVLGAYLVDSLATMCGGAGGREKHEWVGLSGCLFALCFLAPFFRPFSGATSTTTTGLFHFVMSMSLYDTMFSFHTILLSSIITDHSAMSDKSRITFLAAGKVANLVAPMIFAKLALSKLQDVDHNNNLQPLRGYLLVVATMVCAISLVAQRLLVTPSTTTNRKSSPDFSRCCKTPTKTKLDDTNHHNTNNDNTTTTSISARTKKKPLKFKRIVKDFARHPNFRYWIGMEVLLEAQTTYMKSFMKTFVDHLLLEQDGHDGGLSRATCDWFLSSLHVFVAIASLTLLYGPIQRHGYAKVYSWVFLANFGLSTSLILLVCGMRNEEEGVLVMNEHRYLDFTGPIFFFLVLYPTLLGAMGSAGFALAMADMVLELKQTQASQGRWDEPSLAGLFMGMNALFCKPAESILPIITATLLGRTDFHYAQDESNANAHNKSTETVLFRLLVIPPLICSILQLWAWSHYDLHPHKTQRLRTDWETMVASRQLMDGSTHDYSLGDLQQPQDQQAIKGSTTKGEGRSRRQVA